MISRVRSVSTEQATDRGARSCRNSLTQQEAEREWIARILWRAFPEARSENELAELVSNHFTRRGRGVTQRTAPLRT